MTPELYKQLSEDDLRVAIRIAMALVEGGYKPTRGKPILETPEEAERRRRNILEDAPKYAKP